MNNIYCHSVPPSIESRLIQFFMGFLGMKRVMERKIVTNGFSKEPASIPKSILKACRVSDEVVMGRKLWTLAPNNSQSDTIILFLHGGAYYANMTRMHWRLVEQVLLKTNATIVVPNYPLAPESTCKDTYRMLHAAYLRVLDNFPTKQIVFMGDSAGGGLALGFAQKIRNEGVRQPQQIILFSPWLDVTMSNPNIAMVDKFDKILSVKGLKMAGSQYAGDCNVRDYRVSPIYGNFANLGRISIFIGTHDVLVADARKLKHLLNEQQIDFNYFEYPGMFHDWILAANLAETKDVLRRLTIGLKP